MTKCLLFTEKLSVLRYCFIFIVLGWDTSTLGSKEGPQRCDRGVTGGRGITIQSGQTGNKNPQKKKDNQILNRSIDEWGMSSKMKKIELNQKMLILKGFVTKRIFYVMMTTELFVKYFYNIKLC